jgi:uncharacterized protein (TIGR02646 family)
MRQFTRSEEPEILKNNWERIGKDYHAKRTANTSYAFSWPQINREKINHAILPALKNQTQSHCSYCDKYPLYRKDDSIDHFKPKSDERFYMLVCHWENLFLCCAHCQDAKKDQYDDDLLRPDAGDYAFNKYFVYNFTDNMIEINTGLSEGDRRKAEITMKIFDFNHDALIKARENAIFRFIHDDAIDTGTYEFRFLFE